MILSHHKWEQAGRTLLVEGTSQFVYKSQIAQRNVNLGNGQFAPYVWNSQTKILRFATSELHLTDTGLEYWQDGKKLGALAIHPEYKTGTWKRPESSIDGLVVIDVDELGSFAICKLLYTISTSQEDVEVMIQAGGFRKVEFGFQRNIKIAGEKRLLVETDYSSKSNPIVTSFAAEKQKDSKTIGISLGNLEFRWRYAEADNRQLDNISNGKVTQIRIDEGYKDVGFHAMIYPDQWGETKVAHTNDDCQENGGVDLDGRDADGDMCGKLGGTVYDYSCRFQNVTIAANPTSVDTGTQIEYDCCWTGGGSTFTFVVYGLEGDTPDFNTAAPSTRTRTNSSASFTRPSVGNDRIVDGVDFQAVVKEVLDTGWSSGYDIGFTFDNGDCGNNEYFQTEDFSTEDNGTDAARLTIVYTPGGGGTEYQRAVDGSLPGAGGDAGRKFDGQRLSQGEV